MIPVFGTNGLGLGIDAPLKSKPKTLTLLSAGQNAPTEIMYTFSGAIDATAADPASFFIGPKGEPSAWSGSAVAATTADSITITFDPLHVYQAEATIVSEESMLSGVSVTLTLPIEADLTKPVIPTASLVVDWNAITLLFSPGLADDDPVEFWPDDSGNGYDLSEISSRSPTFKTDQLNGLPAVRFAADDRLISAVSVPATPCTIYLVMRVTGTSGGTLIGGTAGGDANMQIYVNADEKLVLSHDTVADYLTAANEFGAGFELHAFVHTGAQATFYRDVAGMPTANGTVANSVSMVDWDQLGWNGFDAVPNDLARVLVYSEAHDETQRQTVWDALRITHGS